MLDNPVIRGMSAEGDMTSIAPDRSLGFHRLQEARQELFEARSKSCELSSCARARLVARCEANLARTEQWLARSSTLEGPPPAKDPSTRLQDAAVH
jgi:hypothetical protein